MKQDYLRHYVKLAKANEDITYKELAETIEISEGSFYNWLNRQYSLSAEKVKYLESILTDLIE